MTLIITTTTLLAHHAQILQGDPACIRFLLELERAYEDRLADLCFVNVGMSKTSTQPWSTLRMQ
jgi:hypothetical protein